MIPANTVVRRNLIFLLNQECSFRHWVDTQVNNDGTASEDKVSFQCLGWKQKIGIAFVLKAKHFDMNKISLLSKFSSLPTIYNLCPDHPPTLVPIFAQNPSIFAQTVQTCPIFAQPSTTRLHSHSLCNLRGICKESLRISGWLGQVKHTASNGRK